MALRLPAGATAKVRPYNADQYSTTRAVLRCAALQARFLHRFPNPDEPEPNREKGTAKTPSAPRKTSSLCELCVLAVQSLLSVQEFNL
jgi:hypothetical protein